jgi:long-chain acyl-CoA synthetase
VLTDFFLNSIDQFGKNVVYFDEDNKQVSYETLIEEADFFVQDLHSRTVVLCQASNKSEFLMAYVGFMRSGLVPLLLPSQLNPTTLDNLISVFSPRFLFLENENLYSSSNYRWKKNLGRYLLFENSKAFVKLNSDLALLLTTSGSTGNSKLVKLSYQNIQANCEAIVEYLHLDNSSRAITSLPFNYSYGLSIINTHLFVGGSIILNENSIAEPKFWEKFQDLNATHLGGVPFSYEMFKRFHKKIFSNHSLKVLTQAGGKLPHELVSFFANECKSRFIDFFVMYGQTEATARMSYMNCEDALLHPKSIGKAIPNGRFSLLDKSGQLIKDANCEGELVFEGPNVFMGYASMQDDLAKDDEVNGKLFTGDLATRDEMGNYYIVGRSNRIAKIYGVRINLQELDDFLGAKGITSASISDDFKVLVYVEDQSNLRSIQKDVIDFLQLRDSLIEVKNIDSLPRTLSGKLNYGALQ